MVFFLGMTTIGFAADLNSVRYVRCYDGDTCTVIIPYLPEPFTTVRVRLRGVDAPEIRGKCMQEKARAHKAKTSVNAWMREARTIDLRNASLGLYGRVVADIILDGSINMAERLLDEGLAVRSVMKRSDRWCENRLN